MSTFIPTTTKFSLIMLSIVLFACNNGNHHTIDGNGNNINQKREVEGNFTSIEVNNAIEVIIEQADKTEVSVAAEDNLQKSILTKVRDGVLIISRQKGNYNSHKDQKVFIKTPVIEEIIANSASSIKTKNTLKGEHIRLNSSSASKMEMELAFDFIEVKSSSASKIKIKGMALNLDVNASSAGKINAEKLLANTITAESSSASEINIHPILSLKANANSGGKIKYNNNPKHTEKTTSSGGTIGN